MDKSIHPSLLPSVSQGWPVRSRALLFIKGWVMCTHIISSLHAQIAFISLKSTPVTKQLVLPGEPSKMSFEWPPLLSSNPSHSLCLSVCLSLSLIISPLLFFAERDWPLSGQLSCAACWVCGVNPCLRQLWLCLGYGNIHVCTNCICMHLKYSLYSHIDALLHVIWVNDL